MSDETCKIKKQPWQRGYTYLHVNQTSIKQCNALRKKALDGEITKEAALAQMPHALSAKTKDDNTYGSTIIVTHPETGEVLMEILHSPFDPYLCGAQIVIRTQMNVQVTEEKH